MQGISAHETIQRVLSMPTRHFTKMMLFIFLYLDVKKSNKNVKTTRFPQEMNLNDTNIYALIVLGRYENRPNDLDNLYLADFASSYISKKPVDVILLCQFQISVRLHCAKK